MKGVPFDISICAFGVTSISPRPIRPLTCSVMRFVPRGIARLTNGARCRRSRPRGRRRVDRLPKAGPTSRLPAIGTQRRATGRMRADRSSRASRGTRTIGTVVPVARIAESPSIRCRWACTQAASDPRRVLDQGMRPRPGGVRGFGRIPGQPPEGGERSGPGVWRRAPVSVAAKSDGKFSVIAPSP